MAILDLPQILPAQVGTHPIIKRMVVSDNLATLIEPGFLNAVNLQGFSVSAGELIDTTFNANLQTKAGPVVRCEVIVVGNDIVLVPQTNGFRIVAKRSAIFPSGSATYVIADAEIEATSVVQLNVFSAAAGGEEATESLLFIAIADGAITVTMTGATTGTVQFDYSAAIEK